MLASCYYSGYHMFEGWKSTGDYVLGRASLFRYEFCGLKVPNVTMINCIFIG
jgi:hypothetical protein